VEIDTIGASAILYYTAVRCNLYDVIVAILDRGVLAKLDR
jgi:hypothetical protein